MSRPDACDAVERRHRYDGPHTPEGIADAAREISCLVRCLANATRRPQPDAVYDAVGPLGEAVGSVDQVLRQLATAARAAGDREAAECLLDARGSAEALGCDLQRAHSAASGLLR